MTEDLAGFIEIQANYGISSKHLPTSYFDAHEYLQTMICHVETVDRR